MEEDYAQLLINEARSSIAVFHEFRINVGTGISFHAFVEGKEDRHYYLDLIRNQIGYADLEFYVCRGKREVVDVAKEIEQGGYSLDGCLFFVDKDVDDFLGVAEPPESIYMTGHYSIENYLTGADGIKQLVALYTDIRMRDQLVKDLLQVAEQRLTSFASAMRPLMAWCLAARQLGKKPNYNNVRLKLLFQFGSGGTLNRVSGALGIFAAECGLDSDAVTMSLLRSWIRRLSLANYRSWLRGKYELWFFNLMLLDLFTTEPLAKRAGGLPNVLRNRALLEVLGPRVRKPKYLVRYVSDRISAASA